LNKSQKRKREAALVSPLPPQHYSMPPTSGYPLPGYSPGLPGSVSPNS